MPTKQEERIERVVAAMVELISRAHAYEYSKKKDPTFDLDLYISARETMKDQLKMLLEELGFPRY